MPKRLPTPPNRQLNKEMLLTETLAAWPHLGPNTRLLLWAEVNEVLAGYEGKAIEPHLQEMLAEQIDILTAIRTERRLLDQASPEPVYTPGLCAVCDAPTTKEHEGLPLCPAHHPTYLGGKEGVD